MRDIICLRCPTKLDPARRPIPAPIAPSEGHLGSGGVVWGFSKEKQRHKVSLYAPSPYFLKRPKGCGCSSRQAKEGGGGGGRRAARAPYARLKRSGAVPDLGFTLSEPPTRHSILGFGRDTYFLFWVRALRRDQDEDKYQDGGTKSLRAQIGNERQLFVRQFLVLAAVFFLYAGEGTSVIRIKGRVNTGYPPRVNAIVLFF